MYEEDETVYDADITQICDFTGLSVTQALLLLKANKNDVGVAINQYMDQGVNALPSMPGVTEGDGDGVRPPLQPHSDILVDSFEARALNRRAIKRPRRTGTSAFDGFRDFAVETNRQEQMLAMANSSRFVGRAVTSHEVHVRRLEDLFRPPLDIIFHGTFPSARSMCVRDGKWLMVNPQSPTEFSCQELNRDIWSDQAIKSIVQANFVFWQVYIDSEEGLAYNQYYPVEKFPYVSIIDPRTGELLKKWNVIHKSHFAEQLIDFLQKNDVEKIFEKDEITGEMLGVEAQECTSALGRVRNLGKTGAFEDTKMQENPTKVAADPSETAQSGAKRHVTMSLPSPLTRDKERTVLRRKGRVACSTVTSADQSNPEPCPVQSPSSSDKELLGQTPVKEGKQDTSESESDSDVANNTEAAAGEKDSSVGLAQIKLCIHFPDKGRKIISFPVGGKIKILHKTLAKEGYPRGTFEYVLNFPKRLVCSKEAGENSFASFGIAHNDTIFVNSKPCPDKHFMEDFEKMLTPVKHLSYAGTIAAYTGLAEFTLPTHNLAMPQSCISNSRDRRENDILWEEEGAMNYTSSRKHSSDDDDSS